MSVVQLAAYKHKGTLTALRELLVLAAKGQITGLQFDAHLKNGQRRCGITGDFTAAERAESLPPLIRLPLRQSRD